MREAAADLEFEEAARLRDEVKRLNAVELAVMDDPLARDPTRCPDRRSRVKGLESAWPQPKPPGRRPAVVTAASRHADLFASIKKGASEAEAKAIGREAVPFPTHYTRLLH